MHIMGKRQVYHRINYTHDATGLGTMGPLQFTFYVFIEDSIDGLINAHETDFKIKRMK